MSVRVHSTALAGIMVSFNTSDRGIAPAAKLIATGSCSGLQAELDERSTFALDAGAQVLNFGFGSDTQLVPSAMDRFYDDIVFNRLRTVVKSAGNLNLCTENGSTGTNDVTSPDWATTC
jgi:hypothetical protein